MTKLTLLPSIKTNKLNHLIDLESESFKLKSECDLLLKDLRQRFEIVWSIAHYKFIFNLPIEHLEQEFIHLQSIKEITSKTHLDEKNIILLFETIIFLSKKIQTKLFENWATIPHLVPKQEPMELSLNREKLMFINKNIIFRLSKIKMLKRDRLIETDYFDKLDGVLSSISLSNKDIHDLTTQILTSIN